MSALGEDIPCAAGVRGDGPCSFELCPPGIGCRRVREQRRQGEGGAVLGKESAVNEAELAAAGERLARVLDGTAAMTNPSVSPKGGAALGGEARQAIYDAMRGIKGPTEHALNMTEAHRVLLVIEPVVRALVAQARAEERERIASRFDSADGDGLGSLAPVVAGLFEQVARIVRGAS